MPIDYAVKYSSSVDEKFKEISKSGQCINDDFDFTGSKAVKVYSVNTASMNDYNRENVEGSRYGNIENLSTTTQEMILRKDRSFTFVIDKMDMDETAMALESGKALERQLREVVTPEIDTYRFKEMCSNAGTIAAPGAITKDNVYDKITTGTEYLDDKEVPQGGRFLIVTPAVYKAMKNSKDITMETEVGHEMRIKGVIAIYDGMPVIKVPSSRLPAEIGFLIGHPSATCSPVKLAEYKIHNNPQGISGYLVEGRIYYDAFILDNKKDALYYHPVSTQTP
jgi:hypothetical protein